MVAAALHQALFGRLNKCRLTALIGRTIQDEAWEDAQKHMHADLAQVNTAPERATPGRYRQAGGMPGTLERGGSMKVGQTTASAFCGAVPARFLRGAAALLLLFIAIRNA